MSLFNRPRSSSQPLVRRISTRLRRRLSVTMPGQRSSSVPIVTPGSDTSSTSATHSQVEPTPGASPLEASSKTNPSNVSTQSIDRESHPHAVELYDNPIDEILLPPECHSTSPSSSSQPSPAYSFADLDSPTTPYS
ncbi:hypothetical protein GGI35DRAFT_444168 [Trichoderma velutinum]